jgi:flagellar biosynthesis protein FlhF
MSQAAAATKPDVEATFAAQDLEQAMALAKRALGPDALIVSSRRVERVGKPPRFEVRATLGQPPDPTYEPSAHESGERITAVVPRNITLLERVLRDNDVPSQFARELAEQEGRPARSLAELRTTLVRILRARVGFGDRTAQARIIALAGPTGVGKTTTIAKLAARDALVNRRKVALISCDDYRVGGADQLARFAELMDVPFAAASDAASLANAVAWAPFAERIYIDTAGRSPRDIEAMQQMASALASVGAAVMLCVPASVRSQELGRVLQQHAPLGPHALSITKLDEAELVGGALVGALASGLPLAFFANGQRVPEDLEPATAERLAAMLLGEEAAR